MPPDDHRPRASSFVNDGSDAPPRLEVHQAWWAMTGIGDGGREWSFEEKLERIAGAGFTGVFAIPPAPEDERRWSRALEQHGLSLGLAAFPRERGQLAAFMELAAALGTSYVTSQVAGPLLGDVEAVALLEALVEEAGAAGIPHFVETHRGRVTQDLVRTADYLEAIPDLRLTVDLSHYVVAGEISLVRLELSGGEIDAAFEPVLRRASAIHGRVSNGEQVQIDVGAEGEHPMVAHFARWWRRAMERFREQGCAGDVLPFVCELGPPPYAVTDGVDGRELSDRWKQSLVLKRVAEDAWRDVRAAAQEPA